MSNSRRQQVSDYQRRRNARPDPWSADQARRRDAEQTRQRHAEIATAQQQQHNAGGTTPPATNDDDGRRDRGEQSDDGD